MKYLIDLFVPYGSFFETNSFSTSISSIWNTFLFLQKSLFWLFYGQKLCSFYSSLYWMKKRNIVISYSIVGIFYKGFYCNDFWDYLVPYKKCIRSIYLLLLISRKVFKEIWKDVSLRLILKHKSGKQYWFGSNLGVEIFLKKREHQKMDVLK